jgi:hypothetical protein
MAIISIISWIFLFISGWILVNTNQIIFGIILLIPILFFTCFHIIWSLWAAYKGEFVLKGWLALLVFAITYPLGTWIFSFKKAFRR